MVTLLIKGGEIELHHSVRFATVRNRANKAKALLIDYQNGALEPEGQINPAPKVFKPGHLLTFFTAVEETEDNPEGKGRISIDVESYLGVMSDDPKDYGSEEEE